MIPARFCSVPELRKRIDNYQNSPTRKIFENCPGVFLCPLRQWAPRVNDALHDSSDWHPKLNDEVANLTDIKSTRIVWPRIYVTSASTMHSLLNVLRHGRAVGTVVW